MFIAIQSIFVQFVSLILTFIFVNDPSDFFKYIAIIAFSKSASGIINFIYVKKKYCRFHFILNPNLSRHLKPILIIFSTTIAITIYVSSDNTMLGFMTNDYQVGLYGTAVKIYTIVKSILASLLVVFVTRFSVLLQDKRTNEANVLFSKVFNTLIVLTLPAVFGLIITSRDVIHLIAGESYLEGTASLRLLCIAISFSIIAALYSSCVLIPTKNEKKVFHATAISAVVNIGLNFGFIPWLGIDGAAITTIIAELIVCILLFLHSRNAIKLKGITWNIISTMIGCMLIFAIGFVTKRLIKTYYLRLFVTVVISVLFYFSSLIILNNPVAKSILSNLKGRILKLLRKEI